MSTTKQSERHSQSDKYIPWFKKNNFAGKWLNEKSKEIIKKLNNEK